MLIVCYYKCRDYENFQETRNPKISLTVKRKMNRKILKPHGCRSIVGFPSNHGKGRELLPAQHNQGMLRLFLFHLLYSTSSTRKNDFVEKNY